MFRNPAILAVTAQFFLLPLFHTHGEAAFQTRLHQICAGNGESIGTVPEIEGVGYAQGGLCHRHIIYRIQKIGLPGTVVTPDAINLGREFQFLKNYVSEICYDCLEQCRHRSTFLIRAQIYHYSLGVWTKFHNFARFYSQCKNVAPICARRACEQMNRKLKIYKIWLRLTKKLKMRRLS